MSFLDTNNQNPVNPCIYVNSKLVKIWRGDTIYWFKAFLFWIIVVKCYCEETRPCIINRTKIAEIIFSRYLDNCNSSLLIVYMQCRNKYFGPLRLLVFHSVIRMLAWIDIIRFIEAVGMIPNFSHCWQLELVRVHYSKDKPYYCQ